jgi:Trk K+ transport system NAD-binding subunit
MPTRETDLHPSDSRTTRRRCILIGDLTGDNRLVMAVATRLIEGHAAVVVAAGADDVDARRIRDAAIENIGDPEVRATARREPTLVVVTPLARIGELQAMLSDEPVAVQPSDCLLALAQDAEQNLRIAVVARRVAPDVRVVMRSFDPNFANQIECAEGAAYVERAYSVAHLSAPSFVAAVLLDDPRAHQVTMRVGVEYVSVCRVDLPEEAPGRRFAGLGPVRPRGLLGRTPNDIVREEGCQVLARRPKNGDWKCASLAAADRPLGIGEQVLVGGPMTDVLDLAHGGTAGRRRRQARQRLARSDEARPRRSPRSAHRVRTQQASWMVSRWRARVTSASTSTLILLTLAVIIALGSWALSPWQSPADMLYKSASTALGNPTPSTHSGLLSDIGGAFGLLAGGIALGLLTSIMSAWLIQQRIAEGMRRRARHLRHHVVIVGLDDVGAQVAALLRSLGVPSAVVVPEADDDVASPAPKRRLQEVADHAPVLTGELLEALHHARIDHACALIACSEDNLVNVQACMRAKRSDHPGGIRMIARIFNDEDARDAARTFRIDHHLAAVEEAAPAFADAALAQGARTIPEGNGTLGLSSVVWQGEREVDLVEIETWHENGIRILARLRKQHLQALSVAPRALARGELAVLAGPADALRQALQPAS